MVKGFFCGVVLVHVPISGGDKWLPRGCLLPWVRQADCFMGKLSVNRDQSGFAPKSISHCFYTVMKKGRFKDCPFSRGAPFQGNAQINSELRLHNSNSEFYSTIQTRRGYRPGTILDLLRVNQSQTPLLHDHYISWALISSMGWFVFLGSRPQSRHVLPPILARLSAPTSRINFEVHQLHIYRYLGIVLTNSLQTLSVLSE
mmetsp:Transcript_23492/g.33562  ORF Transcript_23492/g.33562 Transcript_23492/m.33562 type:complete len:201 (+) Transcript_23492:356-958(+)